MRLVRDESTSISTPGLIYWAAYALPPANKKQKLITLNQAVRMNMPCNFDKPLFIVQPPRAREYPVGPKRKR